ncbi:MAG: hypothetical protein WA793_06800, partial [Sphingorhabdus sp.]|uniref:hypothetical protein n=1 Tax=Sphingorhabdus sp. TaxID=1902408 RepID=UPI003CBBD7B3
MRMFLFLFVFLVACFYAAWKGGAPERLTAAIFAAGLAATVLLRAPYSTRFGTIDMGMFFADFAMLAGLVLVALYAERFWPIWISAFQVIQVLSHLPELLIPHLLPQAYLVIVSVWAYPMLFMLMIATLR